MLTPVTLIRITQAIANRDKVFEFDFCCEYTSSDSWRDFTNKASVKLPKKIYYVDGSGRKVYLGNTDTGIGGFDGVPAFMRGDIVTITSGYRYQIKGVEKLDITQIFSGFISKVTSKQPFELECEDNMWKLKQLPAPNKSFPASKYTLEDILKELLSGSGFTVNALTKTSIGDFRTQNETVMDVLARIRKDYHFESYFRGNELRCGSVVYIESEAVLNKFEFQNNIISDELEYNRKDDVVLSALAYSINKKELHTLTKDGHKKTKHERLEVLVTYQNGKFTAKAKPSGEKADFPPNYTGERRTFYFWNVTDSGTLISLAQAELVKYYYTGFKGKFTTFGIPYVKQGDNVLISDPILPERNGTYKVKSVDYKGGFEGLRQEIELDYRIF